METNAGFQHLIDTTVPYGYELAWLWPDSAVVLNAYAFEAASGSAYFEDGIAAVTLSAVAEGSLQGFLAASQGVALGVLATVQVSAFTSAGSGIALSVSGYFSLEATPSATLSSAFGFSGERTQLFDCSAPSLVSLSSLGDTLARIGVSGEIAVIVLSEGFGKGFPWDKIEIPALELWPSASSIVPSWTAETPATGVWSEEVVTSGNWTEEPPKIDSWT